MTDVAKQNKSVTCIGEEWRLETLPDGRRYYLHFQHWSDGLTSMEPVEIRTPPSPGSAEDRERRARDAAFRAQLHVVALRKRDRPVNDGWTIPREHESALDVAFGDPAFKDATGSLAAALRGVLEARDMAAFRQAVDELERVAFLLTAGYYAEKVMRLEGAEVARTIANFQHDAPRNIADAWRDGVEKWTDPSKVEKVLASRLPKQIGTLSSCSTRTSRRGQGRATAGQAPTLARWRSSQPWRTTSAKRSCAPSRCSSRRA